MGRKNTDACYIIQYNYKQDDKKRIFFDAKDQRRLEVVKFFVFHFYSSFSFVLNGFVLEHQC